MKRLLLPLLALVALDLSAARLATNVVPEHYDVRLEPELSDETFRGDVAIRVHLRQRVREIEIHALELNLAEPTLTIGGTTATATIEANPANESVLLRFAEPVGPGDGVLRIRFDGKLNQQLRGLYVSKTAKRKYAVTQFEATEARRAFPCFDEPAMKATFELTTVIDRGDMAISNSPIVSDKPVGENKRELRFARTPKLPTYLLALIVGDFECVEGAADGTPIRICAVPGKKELGRFALAAAEHQLAYFNRYYGIRYPFAKLDVVAVPDFSAGAMENAAAITYRESFLLLDEKTASLTTKKRIARVMSHEIAHQWFGDYVTMKWWDDIWLNEGFASFMETKPLLEWKPEWNVAVDTVDSKGGTLLLDAQRATRPIRTNAATSAQINELFDAIAYGKAAAVLRMVEEWIGEEAFRDGIRAYLRKYAWSNAAAEDFWNTVAATSRKPVDRVMKSFVDQPGAPVVRVSDDCRGGRREVSLAQQRLTLDQSASEQTWLVPVCPRGEPCFLLDGRSETETLADCDGALFLNRNGRGYFVSDYGSDELAAIRAALPSLSARERISLLHDDWLLVRSARRPIQEHLQLLAALGEKPSPHELKFVADTLEALEQRVVDESFRADWRRWAESTLRRWLPPDPWAAPAGETVERRATRASLLGTLEDAAGARATVEQYLRDGASVDPMIANAALDIAAGQGDEALYDRILERAREATAPEAKYRYLSALAEFRDPRLIARTIDFVFSPEVRAQDTTSLLGALLGNPAARPAAWAAVKSRWPEVTAKMGTDNLSLLFRGLGTACDAPLRADIESFFANQKVPGAERTLARTKEAIDACIALRTAQQENLRRFLLSAR